MAFITNQSANGSAKLGDRLKQLVSHADRLDMLVGFFFFSGFVSGLYSKEEAISMFGRTLHEI